MRMESRNWGVWDLDGYEQLYKRVNQKWVEEQVRSDLELVGFVFGYYGWCVDGFELVVWELQRFRVWGLGFFSCYIWR